MKGGDKWITYVVAKEYSSTILASDTNAAKWVDIAKWDVLKRPDVIEGFADIASVEPLSCDWAKGAAQVT